ncbi:hypothetical protein ACJ72_08432 [Emergomyces africanus]|uniref:Uncharacterized protein n=1 Tax=Emergomyces africanus TaxID=1955775 RepID=A0A1B7NKI2_9EURO|nr:hypothetical protein ACJ72_08432 [Emergomyces africanus]
MATNACFPAVVMLRAPRTNLYSVISLNVADNAINSTLQSVSALDSTISSVYEDYTQQLQYEQKALSVILSDSSQYHITL